MKKIALFLCLILLFSVTPAFGAEEITVTVNGSVLESDVPAQLVNDRTMLPMRAVFEALGATVTWIEADQLILATKDNALITLKIGSDQMSVSKENRDNTITLDAAPYMTNDRTMVPVRAIAEALDATVEWIGETNTVVITQ